MIFLTVFSYKAGMSLWVIPIFFGTYFLLGIMVARVRAELGFMVHDMIGITPHSMIINGFGTRRLGKGTLTIFALYHFFTRTNWANPMPEPLEAFKISSLRNINPRNMAVAILLATVIGSAVTFWLSCWISTIGMAQHPATSGQAHWDSVVTLMVYLRIG